MSTVLECQDIFLSQNNGTSRTILSGIDARFKGGGLSLVTGRTGAGKSSLLHILGGLIRPSSGRVLAGGQPVSRWISRHRDRWRQQVGIVFQHLYLVDGLTVLENVMLPMIPRLKDVAELRQRCKTLLDKLDLSAQMGVLPTRLSGGEQQRVALARALVSHPSYLLADEPTAFQDDSATERILSLLHAHAATGAVVVVCSHDPRLRRDQRVHGRYHLADGRLVPDRTTRKTAFSSPVTTSGEGA